MDMIANKPLSHRYFITKINKYTFLLEDVVTKQIWNVEILDEESTDYSENLKHMAN